MTKEEIINQINETFDELTIKKPLTKQEVINKINETFDKLLIKV
jgi:hypothetical protein